MPVPPTDEATVARRIQAALKARKAKGNKAWKPAVQLDVQGKDPNFRYRWRLNDPEHIQRAQLEGWEFDQKKTGTDKTGKIDTAQVVDDVSEGRLKTSLSKYRELILMRLPEELAKERDEYFQLQTDQQVITPKAFKRHTAKMALEAAMDYDESLTYPVS